MGRKKNDNANTTALTDEEKAAARAVLKALTLALGDSAAPAADDTPADDGLGDDGLGGGDDGLGGGDDGLGGDDTPPEITAEQVRDELKKVIKKLGEDKGREKVAAILKKCGAAKLPDLKEEKFEEAVTLAKKFQ